MRLRFIFLAMIYAPFSVMAAESDVSQELTELRTEALELSQSLKDAKRNARQTARQLDQWHEEEAALLNALSQEEARLSGLLSRMVQASRAAPVSLLTPASQHSWIRQAKIMDVTSRELRSESSDIHHQLSDIEGLRNAIDAQEQALSVSLDDVAERYAVLKATIEARQDQFKAEQPIETKLQRIERRQLASQARNLEVLLSLLEKESGVVMLRSPEEIEMRGSMIPTTTRDDASFQLPAQGTIVRQFGDAGEGGAAQAVHIRTSPRGLIYAPAAGEIVFSGPFRSYGSLLLIKHEGGYMSLVSGFGDPAVTVGQAVISGEPIGYMPREGDAIVSFELRKERKAIDPMPLIAHSTM